MENEFIPYELAVKLKELGFDEPCWAWYNIPDEDVRYCYSEGRSPITNIQEEWDAKIDGKPVENIGLPTFSQAFKFIREKYNLLNIIDCYISTPLEWFIRIDKISNDSLDYKMDITEESEDKVYLTYEEAELACLDKLIELTKNK